jgi:DNA processing protein
MDSRASGGNILLRDGATLVRSAEDVIEALGAPSVPMQTPAPDRTPQRRDTAKPAEVAPADAGPIEARILAVLGPVPTAEDQLVRDLQTSPRELAQALAVLELSGHLRRAPGGMVHLTGS